MKNENEKITGKFYAVDPENPAETWWKEITKSDSLGGFHWMRTIARALEMGPVFLSDEDYDDLIHLDGWETSQISSGPILEVDLDDHGLDHGGIESIWLSLRVSDYDDSRRTSLQEEYWCGEFRILATPEAARRWNEGEDAREEDYLVVVSDLDRPDAVVGLDRFPEAWMDAALRGNFMEKEKKLHA